MSFRNGQWVKFQDLALGINGVTKPLSEHCPNVQRAGDGSIVGIFSVQSRDKRTGLPIPACVTPVSQGEGQNLRLPNEKTQEFDLVTFIDHAAQPTMVSEGGKSLCVAQLPPFQSLAGLVACEDKADLPADRVMSDEFTPQA